MGQTREQIARASEQVAITSQQLTEATHLLLHLSVQLSTLENQVSRPPANLLTIPQEIRDEILNYLLIQMHSVRLHHGNGFIYDLVKQPYLALSSTNKQLRDEAAYIFFKKNKFSWAVIYELRRHIPADHLRMMAQITLDRHHSIPMRIYSRGGQLSIRYCGQEWTIHADGSEIKIRPLRQTSSKFSERVRQRPYRVVAAFQRLIVQSSWMDMEALRFMGREVRGYGLTK